jgi:ubiquinone/menaquinone biosynthesis C-methylase UbiE
VTLARTELLRLLSHELSYREGIWVDEDNLPCAESWSDFASANPISAAIAATDEEGERRKSLKSIEVLRREVDGGALLDVGCGYGRIAKLLLPRCVLDAYIGVDGSPLMLAEFKRRYEARAPERRTPLLLVQGQIDKLQLLDGSVKIVVISAVLLHNPKDVVRQAIEEAHRVLAPGGKLIILGDFPNARSLAGLQGRLYMSILRTRGEAQRNGPVRYYAEREVLSLLSHFDSVRVERNRFQVLPKSLLGLPPRIAKAYRAFIFEPIQRVAERVVPARFRQHFYVDLTIIATKASA